MRRGRCSASASSAARGIVGAAARHGELPARRFTVRTIQHDALPSERGGDVAVPGGLLCAAVVIRLLVVPCLSCAATVALRLFAPAVVPPGDAALTLVLMLESTPPPAMQCMIFCQLFAQDAERPLGKVLVATYVASLVTLTAWIALFLSLLSAG